MNLVLVVFGKLLCRIYVCTTPVFLGAAELFVILRSRSSKHQFLSHKISYFRVCILYIFMCNMQIMTLFNEILFYRSELVSFNVYVFLCNETARHGSCIGPLTWCSPVAHETLSLVLSIGWNPFGNSSRSDMLESWSLMSCNSGHTKRNTWRDHTLFRFQCSTFSNFVYRLRPRY